MDFGIEGGLEAARAATPTDAQIETQLTRIQSSPEFDVGGDPQFVLLRKPAPATASAASRIRSPRRFLGRTHSLDVQTDLIICAYQTGKQHVSDKTNKSKGGENDA